jgi:quercetin 2,3-dioxygenase
MKLYKAKDRGNADYGWLKTNYSFSFADYYNLNMMNYGALRVLNDDIISPGQGFPNHPHKDMEIITVVLKGELKHLDNIGKSAILTPGWIQVMSAGSGIIHSEFNNSKTDSLELFQIWVQTKSRIAPRHEEKKFTFETGWTIVAGESALFINQDAKVSLGKFGAGEKVTLKPAAKKGIYLMVIGGELESNGIAVLRRDAISFEEELNFKTIKKSFLLQIEVPL